MSGETGGVEGFHPHWWLRAMVAIHFCHSENLQIFIRSVLCCRKGWVSR